MTPFRIRVRSTEIDLPVGELLIGRGTDCFLRIDDELVSRRHAKLIVTKEKVIFEDLGSRNGSRVNGEAARGTLALQVGDTFEVGSQSFQLLKGVAVNRATATMMPLRACGECKLLIDSGAATCPHCGAAQQTGEPGRVAQPSPQAQTARGEDDGAEFAAGFTTIAGLADKLLGMGRVDDAEKMIGSRMREALARAVAKEALPDAIRRDVTLRAVKLAVTTARSDWYSFVFQFARAAGVRIEDATLNELHANMMLHKPNAAESLMHYYVAQKGDDEATLLHRKRMEALLRFCRD